MRKILGLTAILAAGLLVVGCLETKQDYTVNPDGSGKVVFELIVEDMPFNMDPNAPQPDPEVTAKRLVKGLLDGSQGVDAWSDVSFGRTDDGRTRFTGTAYFKDFSKLKFKQASMEGLKLVKDDQGGMVLAMEQKQKPGPTTPPPELNEQQMAERIKLERDKFQQMRVMMEAILSKVKIDMSFHLPGKLVEVNNFAKEPSGAVRLIMDGKKMLKVLDEVMTDDAYVRRIIQSGANPGAQMDEELNEKLFGAKGPIRARVAAPLKPMFPYESEVKAAKENYPKMIERLGLDKLPPPAESTMPPGFGLPNGAKGE